MPNFGAATDRAKSALALRQRDTSEITFEIDTSGGISARGYDAAQVLFPQERFKNVIEMISLAKKLSMNTRPNSTFKSNLYEKQPKRRKRNPDLHQDQKTREKDRWTLLMEAADSEIQGKIASLVQSRQQEDQLKAKFAHQAELFRKSPIRSHKYLDKYREMLDISREEGGVPQVKRGFVKREKSASRYERLSLGNVKAAK